MASVSGAYEKSVKGATKSKLAPPKTKYIEHLLSATRAGEAAIAEVFRGIQYRLKETTWTVVFKALIVTHSMIRDGYKNATLDYLANSHQFRITSLTTTGCSPMSEQGSSIRDYGMYLTERIKSFSNIKVDYVKAKNDPTGQGRLRKLSVDKGLLRETESVQKIIGPLITCRFLERDVDNEVALTAFRLLVADLLVLFQVANEGVINVLEHYFEMSKPDAERALKIYKTFVEQTDGVIVFMSLARSLESVTRLTIPNLQHAPTSLGDSLEEYVRDPDFEQNRIQFLATKGKKSVATQDTSAAKTAGTAPSTTQLKSALKQNTDSNPFGAPQLPTSVQHAGNSDLIDFFGSLESPQQQQAQPMQQQQMINPYLTGQIMPVQNTGMYQQPQQQAFLQQQATGFNPYLQQQQQQLQQQPIQQQQQPQLRQFTGSVQPQMQSFTGQAQTMPSNGFGGYATQPTNEFAMLSQPPSQQQVQPLQSQTTGSNPFRKSMLPATMTGSMSSPYAMSVYGGQDAGGMNHLAAQRTGGNPFAKPVQQGAYGQGAAPMQLRAQTTGNPFSKPSTPGSGYGQQQQPMYTGQGMAQQTTGSIAPQQTGSNPFRKSMMPMQQAPMNYGTR
ncbi:ANTH domain-domain-containing protein [Protomyces lactucae-debilis]|uniref:ANTH domain-domain-containing protein n=1 Tax=Protomyces lactucae-debilis TaxID=2754530 RepID=A0A1Y2FQI9_PROLT|nr:ANTH domain-containing protein [Protomyces lactucae-debilis]ORY86263.1 ANTH domain-domain-containing protein [Protomyces lactucae-debilis]